MREDAGLIFPAICGALLWGVRTCAYCSSRGFRTYALTPGLPRASQRIPVCAREGETKTIETMGVGSTALAANLPQLQNLIRRDPDSYREEFAQQLRHFESSLQIFLLNPAADAKDFGELTNFMSHVRVSSPSPTPRPCALWASSNLSIG